MESTSGPVPDSLSQPLPPNATFLHEVAKEISISSSSSAPEVIPPSAPEVVHTHSAPEVNPHSGPEVVFGFNRSMSLSPTFSQGSFNIGTNMLSPGLSSSTTHGTEKEVNVSIDQLKQKKRFCGLPTKFFWVLLALIISLAGLGAGLGAGLALKHNIAPSRFTGKPQYSIGGVIDPAYFSKKGAFNGSGIAFAGSALKSTERGLYTVYYQHYTGSIRYIELSVNGTFEGGSPSEIVASDARNSTAISVVNYVVYANLPNATSISHVFYVGKDGFIKQRTWRNTSVLWADGPATSQNLKILDADRAGLQACYYGSFYGDTEVKNLPFINDGQSAYLQQTGMHLWYADSENTFQQYYTYENMTSWVEQKKWTGMNGHAGVGCYSWAPGTRTYAMFVNQDNVVETWWKDTNSSLASTNEHPISSWQNASGIAIPHAYPSTSLGYTSYLYAMLDDSTIHGYNISYASENSTFADQIVVSDSSGPVKFLNGTHMSVTATEKGLLVFAQMTGDDISMYSRYYSADGTGNVWTSLKLGVDKP